MRILVIQNKATSPEAKVFLTLLSAMQDGSGGAGTARFLVIQFSDERDLTQGEKLRVIPGVEVLSLHTGAWLGAPNLSRKRKLFPLVRLLLSLPEIARRAYAFRPDLIYTSQVHWDVRITLFLSLFLWRKANVIHLHYIPGPWLGKEATWRLKHCARVICVSEFIRQRVIQAGVPADRVVAIRNVLPPDSIEIGGSPDEARAALCNELHIPASDVLVGMVARLNPSKGQQELVQAMAPLLVDPNANCQLILVGHENDPTGKYVEQIRQYAKTEGIAGRIHWLGRRSDVPALLRAFDVFAHPSFEEPLSLAVLEALLAGLPTVVWQEGGPAELVLDGQTGFTVETGNIEALRMALSRLCTDPALRATMRRNALADAARLADIPSAAQRFQQVLAEAAGKV